MRRSLAGGKRGATSGAAGHGDPRLFRHVVVDVGIGGQTLPAGARVLANFALADRDRAVLADPDRLDLSRPLRKHMGFGHGVHSCMGMHPVRTDRLAAPRRAMNGAIRGLTALRARVRPGRAPAKAGKRKAAD